MLGSIGFLGGLFALATGATIKQNKTNKVMYIPLSDCERYSASTNLKPPVNTAERRIFLNKVNNIKSDPMFIETALEGAYKNHIFMEKYVKDLLMPWVPRLAADGFDMLQNEEYLETLIKMLSKPCCGIPDTLNSSCEYFYRYGGNCIAGISILAQCISDTLDILNGYFPFHVRGGGMNYWVDIIHPFNYFFSIYDGDVKDYMETGVVHHLSRPKSSPFEKEIEVMEYGRLVRHNKYQHIFASRTYNNTNYTKNPVYPPIDTDESLEKIWIVGADLIPSELKTSPKKIREYKLI